MASTVALATDVIHDPYFTEAMCRVTQLKAIENKQPLPPCTKTPAGLPGGVGLRPLMPAIRGYVYGASKPAKWPLIAAAAGVVGLPLLLGYAIGKGR